MAFLTRKIQRSGTVLGLEVDNTGKKGKKTEIALLAQEMLTELKSVLDLILDHLLKQKWRPFFCNSSKSNNHIVELKIKISVKQNWLSHDWSVTWWSAALSLSFSLTVIHFLNRLSIAGHRETGTYPSWLRVPGGVHPHVHSYGHFREPTDLIFGLVEKTGGQAGCRPKNQAADLLGVLKTAPLCRKSTHSY